MHKVIDTPYSIAGKCHAILSAGYDGVIRYISPSTSRFPHKRCTLDEVKGARSVKLAMGFVWEISDQVDTLTAPAGLQHAASACDVLSQLGIPLTTAIYFAVDFDATPDQMDGVQAYFESVHTVVRSRGRLCGVYGSGFVCKTLFDLGLVHYKWRAQSHGWADYADQRVLADILQGPSTTVAGLDCDPNDIPDLHGAGFLV